MELPQSSPFGTAQARKATHDFLSLYSHSSLPQDPMPPRGGFPKTHNFLQPLEREDKYASKEDNSVDINIEKPPPAAPATPIEHVLPGGIGTYSISHISYFNPRVPKPEENVFTVAAAASSDKNDDNSNCSSYTGSGFTLWNESAVRKGNAGKENSGDINAVKEATSKVGQWPLDRPSQSSSNHRSSVSPFSSSQTLSQKNQSFMEMIKSARGPHSMDEDEDDVTLKKESSSSQKGELRVKVDGKSNDKKPNTPRSKHSATEQRRRCKINDRFQVLREIIPHSDQKRDKASFLLEVIEYIQFLQEKVNRYEGYPGWNSEPPKLAPWRNSHGPPESLMDQSRVINGIVSPVLMFGAKLNEKASAVPLNMPRNPQIPAESDETNATSFKTIDQQSGMANKAVPISSSLQPDVYTSLRNGCPVIQPPPRLQSDKESASHPQLNLWQNRMTSSEPFVPDDKLKNQELALEGGTISISSIYSQGLLNTLTRALQSSGVDLSQASISVQVDIGKRANNGQNEPDPFDKVTEAPSGNQSFLRSRVASANAESDHAIKRLKTS
uniref:BHLH domain-containing protein n=1 Tax=Opuntia streptacantha TaxID=393608 RepID=A0A7C9CXF2_OPUST